MSCEIVKKRWNAVSRQSRRERVKGAKSPLRVQSNSFSNFLSLKSWTGSGAKRLFRHAEQLASFQTCKLLFSVSSEPILLPQNLWEQNLSGCSQHLSATHFAHFLVRNHSVQKNYRLVFVPFSTTTDREWKIRIPPVETVSFRICWLAMKKGGPLSEKTKSTWHWRRMDLLQISFFDEHNLILHISQVPLQ